MPIMKDLSSLKRIVFASSYLVYDPSQYLSEKFMFTSKKADVRTETESLKLQLYYLSRSIDFYYSEKNYQQVISTYSKGAYPMSETIRPKMLLMVGNSFRQLQRHRDAVSVYIMLREHYPASKEASESEYRKLLSLFNLRSKSIPKYVDNFVEWQTPRDSNHKNIDMALLLKAEHYFNKKQ